MAIIISETNDIHYNLATEEYLLRYADFKDDILFIWPGSKAFVYGRNQNPYIEINPKSLLDESVPKIRRVSGGGTIYQDEGTINFSYITNDYRNKINHYQYFLDPIIDLLKSYNLNAYFKAKSHIFIDEYKISGNAQAFINNRLLHHGTLLFNTDLSVIKKALISFNQEAVGHQVLSNKQPVMNLSSVISENQNKFIEKMIDKIVNDREIIVNQTTNLDMDKINQIKEDKYLTWDWNFGKTPKFIIETKILNDLVSLTIDKGFIKEVHPPIKIDLIDKVYYSKEYFKLIQKEPNP